MAEKYANETTDGFMDRLGVTLIEGYKAMGVAFGFQSGLFKTMVDHSPKPMTSQEIADSLGFKERYVREWLGLMVTGGIIEVDAASERFHLPAHRVPAFKEGDPMSVTAAWCRGVPLFSEAYNVLLDAVKKDGPLGVPYSKYSEFDEFQANCSLVWLANELCQSFIQTLPELQERLEKGIRVLDVGCGRGGASENMALHFPNSAVVGLDISEDAIQYATTAAKTRNLSNLSYVCADAVKMPGDWSNSFDYVFIYDVIHDVPRPDLMLGEIHRVLKPGGTFSCLDPAMHTRIIDNIQIPYAPAVYACSLFHCLPVSYQFPGSLGLGAAWGKEACIEFLKHNKFTVLSTSTPPGGDDMIHYYTTPTGK